MGHYKAISFDNHLSALHAGKLSLAEKMDVSLVWWGIGVTVLLENIAGNNFVNKPREVCLFEADFNLRNKLTFCLADDERSKRLGYGSG